MEVSHLQLQAQPQGHGHPFPSQGTPEPRSAPWTVICILELVCFPFSHIFLAAPPTHATPLPAACERV